MAKLLKLLPVDNWNKVPIESMALADQWVEPQHSMIVIQNSKFCGLAAMKNLKKTAVSGL